MCTTCGCGDPALVPVELHEKILAGNDRTAAHNRAHFREAGVLALNLMGSPGSGKTAVLEATASLLPGVRMGAVSADLATDNDARRLTRAGIPSQAITTGQACHLDAELVHASLHGFDWEALDLFFIENVGNLVCPAIYDLGQAQNVVVLSVTEGEDKPLKYPVMFQKADLVLLTKADLVPHLDVDVAGIRENLARVMPEPRMILVSARTGLGMGEWRSWLEARRPAGAGAARLAAHDHGHGHAHEHRHEHEHAHGRGDHAHAHPHPHGHSHPHDHGAEPAEHRGGLHVHGGPDHGHEHGGDHHDHAHEHGHQHPHASTAPEPQARRTRKRKAKGARAAPARKAARKPVRKGPAARARRRR